MATTRKQESIPRNADDPEDEFGYNPSWRPRDEGSTDPNPLWGTLEDIGVAPSRFGDQPILTVKGDNGQTYTVWCMWTSLRSQVGRANPRPGERIGIKYVGRITEDRTGKKLPDDKQYEEFRVKMDRKKGGRSFRETMQEHREEIAARQDADDDIPF